MNRFQYYQNFYSTDRYANNSYSAAEFGGDSEAADVAGKLFDRWTTFDFMAEISNYEDEQCNREAEAAYQVYEDFTAMLREAGRIHKTYQRVLVVEAAR